MATAAAEAYRGAETCDLVPDWVDSDAGLLALLRECHAADPDELTPQLALADLLGERGDPREVWVRAGCDLWAACRELDCAGTDPWDYEAAKAALLPVCQSVPGWRLACLWGCLVAWHAPAGGGGPMGRTWADARVRAVNRCVWWWSLGFLAGQACAAGSQADAAWRQAYAAGSQACAAGSQADAAWRQADAAWRQALAAGRQACAAGSQADAAWSQALAAGRQADAAWRQADAAWSQADAAWMQADVWRFARFSWGLCSAKLPLLGGA